MSILNIVLLYLFVGCSDCSQKSNSSRDDIPGNPKHDVPVIPLLPSEDQTPPSTPPDEPTTPPDKPKPPTSSENDKQKYEWIDITFEDDASYNDKIHQIKHICCQLFIAEDDSKVSKLIIKSGNNEVTLSSDIFADPTTDNLKQIISKKIPLEYMNDSCLRIQFLKNEIKSIKDMTALFWVSQKIVSVDFSNIDISHVKIMCNMFNGCSSLKSVYGLKNLNKSGNYSYMFIRCNSLTYVENVEQWNLSSANTDGMFDGCPLLKNPSWYKGS